MGKFEDLTGQRFGKLTVIKRAENRDKKVYWTCLCDCQKNKYIDIEAYSLKSGRTLSCGCYGAEQRLKANTKHGLSHSRIKKIYNNMHSRCENPNIPKFKNHGGRGIIICNEWSGNNGFENFYKWAFSNGYSDELTLDRIDNDGNYEPLNCRWTTFEEQNFNRRNNRLFEINGVTKHAKEWCDEYQININTFWQRDRKGLTGEDLIKPAKTRKKKENI